MSSRISLDPKILFIIFDIDAPMMSVLPLPSVERVCCSVVEPTRSAGVARDVTRPGSRESQAIDTGEQSARA